MKPDQGSCLYGAAVIRRHLRSLEDEFAGVHSGAGDIEYIHRMRVASRRLRATLPLFQGCFPRRKAAFWLKEIRKVTRALGAARDTDVQIEAVTRFKQKQKDPVLHPGLSRLALRLRQQRERQQPALTAALDELRELRAIEDMDEALKTLLSRAEGVYIYSPGLYAHSWNAITARLAEFLGFDEIVHQPGKVTELHNMRIAAKWLRYTMETFAALYPDSLKPWLRAVRGAQELLGDVHDCDVWAEFIPHFLNQEYERVVAYFGASGPYPLLVPGIEAFAANRLEFRAEQYNAFRQAWDQWAEERVWDGLRQALQIPASGGGMPQFDPTPTEGE